MFNRLTLAALAALVPSFAAAEMIIENGYARSSNPRAGAAFMIIENRSDLDDRVIAVRSDAAARVELHTHIQDAEGVMRMVEVEDGFPIAAGEALALERGGAHVMLMGLVEPLGEGDEVTITLEFEHAEAVEITVPVQNDRDAQSGHNN